MLVTLPDQDPLVSLFMNHGVIGVVCHGQRVRRVVEFELVPVFRHFVLVVNSDVGERVDRD